MDVHLVSTNPATGQRQSHHPQHTDAEVELILGRAHHSFRAWRKVSLRERANTVRKLATALRARANDLAHVAAVEMGKPITQGKAEVEKCALCCDQQADIAPALLADHPIPTEARRSFVAFEPLGVVLAIMPWNFPFWQVVRAAVPAILAGNTVVLKHASNVTRCALALEDVFLNAELPTGVFCVLRLDSSRIPTVITHPAVQAVTLTGSTPAGRDVAAIAGAALRKTVLELGGNDAYVVLGDADIPHAARICAQARLINGGQSCIAAKRFIVVESARNEFEELLLKEFAAVRLGDPLDPSTTLGPLARADLRTELHSQVTRAISAGASCLTGGRIPEGPGFFYPPTILTDVTPGMSVFEEETFGPVASVISATSENEAIDLANRSRFGLGAALFTSNSERGAEIAARRLEAGNCFVNSGVRSDPRLPFGGIRDSGWGRELGAFGLREFVNTKTVYIA